MWWSLKKAIRYVVIMEKEQRQEENDFSVLRKETEKEMKISKGLCASWCTFQPNADLSTGPLSLTLHSTFAESTKAGQGQKWNIRVKTSHLNQGARLALLQACIHLFLIHPFSGSTFTVLSKSPIFTTRCSFLWITLGNKPMSTPMNAPWALARRGASRHVGVPFHSDKCLIKKPARENSTITQSWKCNLRHNTRGAGV